MDEATHESKIFRFNSYDSQPQSKLKRLLDVTRNRRQQKRIDLGQASSVSIHVDKENRPTKLSSSHNIRLYEELVGFKNIGEDGVVKIVKPNDYVDEENSLMLLESAVYEARDDTFKDYVNPTIDINVIKYKYFGHFQSTNDGTNRELPIFHYRDNLISSINSYNVVIVEGGTGTGKSTQVPFFILKDCVFSRDQEARIFVTQPRRIAARSIAKRVCQEHNWELGSIVGYQIGLERSTSPDTMLTFCTSGTLLQKIIAEGSLDDYSHIIIDEVHERDADTDLLLMVIRAFMTKKSCFKLIIMSATANIEKLVNYFNMKSAYGHASCIHPRLCTIKPLDSGIRHHKVDILYLGEICEKYDVQSPPDFSVDCPELNTSILKVAVKLIIDIIPTINSETVDKKSILVFLPGLSEINQMFRRLNGASACLDIIVLHSCLSANEQNRVFLPLESGLIRVILATNIAESSITVKEVGYVIDFCLTKLLMKDPHTNFPCLKLTWASKDKMIQRAGRTGRCCPGTVYRLIPNDLYSKLAPYATPELMIAPLELSVLRVKRLNMSDTITMLSSVLDPPKLYDIKKAVLELKQIGALTSTYNGEFTVDDGDITELGRIISILPIDVRLSKLVVYGHALQVVNDAITIAACLSTNRTIVKHVLGNEIATYKNKLVWAAGSNCDFIICLSIVKEYKELLERGKSRQYIRDWCESIYVDDNKLHDVLLLEKEIIFRLQSFNIVINDETGATKRDPCEDELMLKVAICAAFYPNYFLSTEFEVNTVQRELLNQDPCKSVVVGGMPYDQSPLYHDQIYNQLEPLVGDFEYISNNCKAVLRFGGQRVQMNSESTKKALGVDGLVEGTGNGVLEELYVVLKREQENSLFIREYTHNAARERLLYYTTKKNAYRVPNRLPPSDILLVKGRQADNRRLIEMQQQRDEHYIEIEINIDQNDKDYAELEKIEEQEDLMISSINHDTFKSNYSRLKGPSSPICMSFRPLLRKSKSFLIEVEKNSVNSVLLDADYKLKLNHLLVAASVSMQTRRNILRIRDTTLMPTVRGLPALLAMLFAPDRKYDYDEQLDCITSACFGLGWYQSGLRWDQSGSYDRDSEIEMAFDVMIGKADIELIDKCRRAIATIASMLNTNDPGIPLQENQLIARETIMSLIRKRRMLLNLDSSEQMDYVD